MSRRARGRARRGGGDDELPVAPLIDMVFLLLAYFMVTATIQKQEADLGFALPAVVAQSEPVGFPDELFIEIDSAGAPSINGYAYDSPEAPRFAELAATLSRYRQSSEAAGDSPRVTLAPTDATPHEFVVRAMDACAAAGVTGVGFALSGE